MFYDRGKGGKSNSDLKHPSFVTCNAYQTH